MPSRQRTIALLTATSFVSLGLAYLLLLPPYEGFDETGHYSYVTELADCGRITDLRSSPLDATIEADLAGTWTLSGSTVTFSPNDPNSIIGDADFTAAQNSLDGEGTFEGITLHLTLAKTG